MLTRFAHVGARTLPALALSMLLARPAELLGQKPSVRSAVLSWPSSSPAADSGRARLTIRIAGLSPERLKAVNRAGMVIADRNNKTYTPMAIIFGPRDRMTGESDIAEQRYVFLVPYPGTKYELRLPGFAAVPFEATVSLASNRR
jgi:hypothetical protein